MTDPHIPHAVRKQRGPYKKYLRQDSDFEIPRTTAYRKRKLAKAADAGHEVPLENEISAHILDSSTTDQGYEVESSVHVTNPCIHSPATTTQKEYEAEIGVHHTDSDDSPVLTDDEYLIEDGSFHTDSSFDSLPTTDDEYDVEDILQATIRENVESSSTMFGSDTESETYSMFEGRCPYASSSLGSFVPNDAHGCLHCSQEMNADNNPTVEDQERYFSEVLCKCTSTNRGEAVMAVITLGIRHSFTWTAIVDTMKMINSLFGNDVVPATKYKLFKYFNTGTNYFRYNIICPNCDSLLGKQYKISENEVKMCKCGQEVEVANMESFFLSASFDKQLKNTLEKREVSQNINYRHTRPDNPEGDLTDIYDGKIYKDLSAEGKPLSFQYNLSYTFNTDGCQAGDSSTTSLWPIYATINELPPNLRSKNMILVGVWACKRKPHMSSFLQPFVEDANELSSNGITWEIDGTGIVTSKIFAICSSVDSVARSAMMNMKQFNGYYGCTMCEHPGELVKDKAGSKSIKYTVSSQVPPYRTHDSIVNNMKQAYDITCKTRKRISVKGVFGPSPLMNLMHFDLASGLPPDNMHLLSGLAKQYTNMLLTDNGEDYYVGAPAVSKVIDDRLLAMTPPTCITRTPRSLKHRALWKASEWRSWLTFYSLVCLRGILPEKYLIHLSMLITAIRILLDERISRDGLQCARELLIKFVVLFQAYFGKATMNYNVHLLLHVCRGVENYGPLWTHNAYQFENENRHLLELKKSPTHLALQICRRFVLYKTVSGFSDNFQISDRIKDFCEELSHGRLRFTSKISNCTLIGNGKQYFLNTEELTCLEAIEFNDCLSYRTIIFNNFRYNSEVNERAQKTNNTVVMTVDGKFAVITNICKISKLGEIPRVVVFCRELQVIDDFFLTSDDVTVTHIKKCKKSTASLQAYSPENLQSPCILMETNCGIFVASIPKGCLGD